MLSDVIGVTHDIGTQLDTPCTDRLDIGTQLDTPCTDRLDEVLKVLAASEYGTAAAHLSDMRDIAEYLDYSC